MAEGFQGMAITAAHLPDVTGHRLEQAVANGWHGDMTWLAETIARRRSPDAMWEDAKSAIMLAMSYAPDIDPMVRLDDTSSGVISVYALNRDYHDIIKGKLKHIAQWLSATSGHEVKVFVDTAPLMEKPLAEQSGLGWQGKHTNLVSQHLGSWFFLGSILTTFAFESDAAETDHCGTCRACLDICPTKAFPQPHALDARRCISYLTIEHKGHIAEEFRLAMGNRIYGCDDCLAACPWNKFAVAASEARLAARPDLVAPRLLHLLGLDELEFRATFSGSPVKRIGHTRFIRNCLIAAGNSGDPDLIPVVRQRMQDTSPIIRAMAVWALRQLSADQFAAAIDVNEADADVRREWGLA